MRAILVPVADRPECESALSVTFELARRLGADVLGCHFTPAPIEPGNWDLADLWTMNQSRAWPVPDDEAGRRLAEAARALFARAAAAARYGISDRPGTPDSPAAHWETQSGSPLELMPVLGGGSDMIVVSRAPEHGGEKAWLVLTSALLESLRPVLVLPQKATPINGRRVAVAWKGGRTETLALHASLPLIKRAEEVVLLTVGGRLGRGADAERIVRFLALHGVAARAKTIDRTDEGPALVAAAGAEGADVLVAGAYTRGRFREMIFGGVTEFLVTKTEFPVLLMHA